jgi:hypothetical protein
MATAGLCRNAFYTEQERLSMMYVITKCQQQQLSKSWHLRL